MGKIAFVFPGQGSQYVGMGKEIFQLYPEARQCFEQADEALGFALSQLCFAGPEEELRQTYNTQPAILTISVACWTLLHKKGVTPDYVAGHSLGEYSALVAAGSLRFLDAVRLVAKRGRFMENAVPSGTGTMAAILGLTFETVEEICRAASSTGMVQPANYNCPGQVVIAGAASAVEEAITMAKEAGAKRAIMLNVSGPFHSSLMEPAAIKLSQELEKVEIVNPLIPVVANVNANFVNTGREVRDALVRQVANPVLWDSSVRKLIGHGVDTFVEVGPGKILSGLIKKINKQVTLFNVEDGASLEQAVAGLRRF